MDSLLIIVLLIILALVLYYYQKDEGWDYLKSVFPLCSSNKFDGGKEACVDQYLNPLFTDKPPESYLKSKYEGNYGHSYSFSFSDASERERIYKVYPLCCINCKISAIKEVKNLESGKTSVPKLYNKFVTSLYPNPNIKIADNYLVIEKEKISDLNDSLKIGGLKYDSFVKLLTTLNLFKKEGFYVDDLTSSNLGLNLQEEIKIINLDCLKPFTGANIYLPKFSVLTKLNPTIFASEKDKSDYLKIVELIKKNKFSPII